MEKSHKSMTVVLCSKGYPGKYIKKTKLLDNINNTQTMSKSEFIYHAGTKLDNGKQLLSSWRKSFKYNSLQVISFLKIRNKIIRIN